MRLLVFRKHLIDIQQYKEIKEDVIIYRKNFNDYWWNRKFRQRRPQQVFTD